MEEMLGKAGLEKEDQNHKIVLEFPRFSKL